MNPICFGITKILQKRITLCIPMEIMIRIVRIHNDGFIHRDIHGGNILLDIDEDFKDDRNIDKLDVFIADFGLSCPANKPLSNSRGTYMAPEVLRGESRTYASDIYAFGILMWELSSNV
jgi:serine/threonine protein kinase